VLLVDQFEELFAQGVSGDAPASASANSKPRLCLPRRVETAPSEKLVKDFRTELPAELTGYVTASWARAIRGC
jgi:hypothetical protein